MPSGGRRHGAGRKEIDPFDPLTLFCAEELRWMLQIDPALERLRYRRGVRLQQPSDLPHADDLDEAYKKLHAVPIEKRRAIIDAAGRDGPTGNELDDVRHIINVEMGGRRWVTLPPPSPTEMGLAYAEIARRASAIHGVTLSRWQVKHRIEAYFKNQERRKRRIEAYCKRRKQRAV